MLYATDHIPSSRFSFSHEIEPFGPASCKAKRASLASCLSSCALALEGFNILRGRVAVAFLSALAGAFFGIDEVLKALYQNSNHHIRHSITAVITNPITTTARRMNTRPTRCAVRAPT